MRHNLFLFPAITIFSFLEVLMTTFVMLALSSLSRSRLFVGILYTALIFFSQALFGVLTAVTGGTRISWISYPANLTQIGDVIFRLRPHYETPWPVSLVMIVALVIVSAATLAWRVRGVEVVA